MADKLSGTPLSSDTVARLNTWLQGGFLPPWALESLNSLLENKNHAELSRRFFEHLSFKTAGMRGRVIAQESTEVEYPLNAASPVHPAVGSSMLNEFHVLRATLGFFRYFQKDKQVPRPHLVVARDNRHFSQYFAELTASLWQQRGGQAYLYELPTSTPQLSFTVRYLRAEGAVMMTASHNPSSDNGYKIYGPDGAQISQNLTSIVRHIKHTLYAETVPYLQTCLDGVRLLGEQLDTAYEKALLALPLSLPLSKPSLVFTPLHGTGIRAMPKALRACGKVRLVEEQATLDPDFPTVDSPNPENPQSLQLAIAQAKKEKADLVLATDPDADRLNAVETSSSQPYFFSGNQLAALLLEDRLRQLKGHGILPHEGHGNAMVLSSLVSSPLIGRIAKAHGVSHVETLTGFKYIGDKLKKWSQGQSPTWPFRETLEEHQRRGAWQLEKQRYFIFGCEESYGYLTGEHARDKDAHAAAILLTHLLARLRSGAEGPNDTSESLRGYLEMLWRQHGLHLEKTDSLRLEGEAGQARIARLMHSYRETPLTQLGPWHCQKTMDFETNQRDSEGDLLPKENFLLWAFNNSARCAVRPSGTEAKMKFYTFVREPIKKGGTTATALAKGEENLKQLSLALKLDALERLSEEGSLS